VGVEANTNKTECVRRILYKAGHTHFYIGELYVNKR
jgi:hypothetical protein